MKKIKSHIGKCARFHNVAHYPSLNHKLGTITSDYRNDKDMGPYCYGILIDGETRAMAASKYEIELI